MTVTSTTGLKIRMSKAGITPAKVVPTAISSAKPAVVTVATTGMADGQLVLMSGTGFPELDGKAFIVSGLSPTEFSLTGSDTTATTGTLAATPAAVYYSDTVDMIGLCTDAIDISSETSSPVGTPTFCDESAQIPGPKPGAGTWTLGLYLDVSEPGYLALLAAEADGLERQFKVTFPGGNGDLVASGVVSSVGMGSIAVGQPVQLTAVVDLKAKAVHLF